VVLPDRALCLPTFCHLFLTVNKPSSSSLQSLLLLAHQFLLNATMFGDDLPPPPPPLSLEI